jgi:hypothetical protein
VRRRCRRSLRRSFGWIGRHSRLFRRDCGCMCGCDDGGGRVHRGVLLRPAFQDRKISGCV